MPLVPRVSHQQRDIAQLQQLQIYTSSAISNKVMLSESKNDQSMPTSAISNDVIYPTGSTQKNLQPANLSTNLVNQLNLIIEQYYSKIRKKIPKSVTRSKAIEDMKSSKERTKTKGGKRSKSDIFHLFFYFY